MVKRRVHGGADLAHSVQEAVYLALRYRLPFVCGYQRRFDRSFAVMKKQADAGCIGQLKILKSWTAARHRAGFLWFAAEILGRRPQNGDFKTGRARVLWDGTSSGWHWGTAGIPTTTVK